MGGRGKQIGVRLDGAEHDLIERIALRNKRKVADYVRTVALTQATAEDGGAPPLVATTDTEEVNLELLRQIEKADAELLAALVQLGRAAKNRQPVARVLKDLAIALPDAERGGVVARSRRGRHRGRGRG